MSLQDEIVPYLQTTGLVSNVISIGQYRTCDNGVLFTSEYLLIRKLQGGFVSYLDMVENPTDKSCFDAIANCTGKDGYLHRAPDDLSDDETDDYHGAYAAYIQSEVIPPFKLRPGLYRQPQLIALAALASKSIIKRILVQPLIIYSALVIATSCIGSPQSDYDSRILSWLLIKGTQSSWLCGLAAWVWKRRLMKMYLNGMQDVFAGYFGIKHPLAKYAVIS